MTLVRSSGTVIQTLRTTSAERDQLAVKLRLHALLASADLEPNGLTPAAIVCVRSVQVPPPGQRAIEWGQRVRGTMDSIVRGAAHPARGVVTDATNAVVFADMAELLGCMATDATDGVLAGRWWWRCLLQRTWPASMLVDHVWRNNAAFVPAALASLVQRRRTDAVAAVVEPLAVLRAVNHVFGLEHLDRATSDLRLKPSRLPARTTTPRADDVASRPRIVLEPTSGPSTKGSSQPPPWRSCLPPALEDGLSVDSRMLLGIGLAIMRMASLSRSQAFAVQVAEWHNGVVAAATEHSPVDDLRSPHATPPSTRQRSAASDMPQRARPPDPPRAHRVLQRSTGRGDLHRQDDGALSGAAEDVFPYAMELLDPGPDADSRERVPPGGPPPDWEDEIGVDSEYGGLFYLLNVALRLGFYPDFSRPADPSIPISAWEFLLLVGRRLVGDALTDDPVWRLIAELGGCSLDGERSTALDEHALEKLTRAVRVYVVGALRLPEHEDAAFVLCRHTARIVATPTRVDVLLRLVELPIEIRRAGLDRDPGWLPAAGRSFAFHFD